MNCLAIDDEKLVLDLLVDNISHVPFLKLVKACRNAMEAAAVLQEEQIDLIFIDIQMPRLSGLQFIKTLPHPPLVIFITAYEQYALESYELDVVDYLLKPVSFDRFLKACNKAQERFLQQKAQLEKSTHPPTSTSEESGYLFVNVEYTLVKVAFADILFIEGLKDYVRIYLSSSSRPVVTKLSLKAMEEKLPAALFIRIHKSYIVAIHRISVVKRDWVCIGAEELPVSEAYKEQFLRVIKGA